MRSRALMHGELTPDKASLRTGFSDFITIKYRER